MMMTEAMQTAIAALDRAYPGWQARIDIERLDVFSLDNCILAQIGILKPGNFGAVVESLVGWPEPHQPDPESHPAAYFVCHEDEWREYLTACQAEHASEVSSV